MSAVTNICIDNTFGEHFHKEKRYRLNKIKYVRWRKHRKRNIIIINHWYRTHCYTYNMKDNNNLYIQNIMNIIPKALLSVMHNYITRVISTPD